MKNILVELVYDYLNFNWPRCESSNPCEQRCTDNGVAVTCSCNPGYVLANDKRSCTPKSSENQSIIPDEEDFSSLCPQGYRYNATNQVCDGKCEKLVRYE